MQSQPTLNKPKAAAAILFIQINLICRTFQHFHRIENKSAISTEANEVIYQCSEMPTERSPEQSTSKSLSAEQLDK